MDKDVHFSISRTMDGSLKCDPDEAKDMTLEAVGMRTGEGRGAGETRVSFLCNNSASPALEQVEEIEPVCAATPMQESRRSYLLKCQRQSSCV